MLQISKKNQLLTFKYFLLAVTMVFISHISYSQVNTEVLRKSKIKTGFNNTISAYYAMNSGNSEFSSFKANFRSDFQSNLNSAFLVINFHQKNEGKRLIVHKAFTHLRYMRELNKKFTVESFLQKGFNDFLSLKSRELIGTGFRTTLLQSKTSNNSLKNIDLYIGNGLMWEQETLTNPKDKLYQLLRSTNYLSLVWLPFDKFKFISITYYQFDVRNIPDYRILTDCRFSYEITKRISITSSLEYRYDSAPPLNTKNYDIEIINGLTINL